MKRVTRIINYTIKIKKMHYNRKDATLENFNENSVYNYSQNSRKNTLITKYINKNF